MSSLWDAFRLVDAGDVGEWAERYRILPYTSPEPGPWRTERTPYLREIMTQSGVSEQIAIKKSAQVGGTEILLNAIGYLIAVEPGPAMVVQPTRDLAREWSLKRLSPLIESTPQIQSLFGASKKNPNNTIAYKAWPGGFLRVAYAAAASQLRSDAVRWLLLDEIDAYPSDVDGEGDPVTLAVARTTTFGERRRILYVSTPTDAWSRIDSLYAHGDCRVWYWPCPHCDEYFAADEHLADQLQPTGEIVCPHCGVELVERDKHTMLERGHWRVTRPDGAYPSYHITGFMSPPGWLPWTQIAQERAEASTEEEVRTWWNTRVGVSYTAPASHQALSWEPLYHRRGRLSGIEGAPIRTAGVDVQADRLECEIVAWGPGMRSWSVEYLVITGDPTQGEVWRQLDDIAARVHKLCVDTGYLRDRVLAWARPHLTSGVVMPVRGLTRGAGHTVGAPSDDWVWPVNVDRLKGQIYAWLDLPYGHDTAPDGWCEFAAHDQEWFRQLCSEAMEMTSRGPRWVKTRDRNEALDCRVYALAGAIALGAMTWSEQDWAARMRPTQRRPRTQRSKWLSGE